MFQTDTQRNDDDDIVTMVMRMATVILILTMTMTKRRIWDGHEDQFPASLCYARANELGFGILGEIVGSGGNWGRGGGGVVDDCGLALVSHR